MTDFLFQPDGKTLRAFDPALSPFALLGLEPRAKLDDAALKVAYLNVSRLVHPDRFQRAAATQREAARAWSSAINAARATLKDQRLRLEALFDIAGLSHDADQLKPPAALLMEVFEINEMLDDLEGQAIGEKERTALRTQREATLGAIRDTSARLQMAATDWDVAKQDAAYQAWKEVVASERYLRRILERIEAAERAESLEA